MIRIFTFIIFCCLINSPIQAQDCFRTQTIGGWGSSPSGNNPGTYLQENFEKLAGSNGEVAIGYGDNMIIFTDAQSISAFLPATGTARVVTDGLIVNPTKREIKNTFASQVLALTITAKFDTTIPDFSESTFRFVLLEVAEGPFQGVSVIQVLNIANRALSGEETGYSLSEINNTVSRINESFVDGNCGSNTGFLKVPEISNLRYNN